MNYTYNSDPSYYKKHMYATNCGSFAFNLKEWYNPDLNLENQLGEIDNWIYEMDRDGFSDYEITDIYLKLICEQVLIDFQETISICDGRPPTTNDQELIALSVYCFVNGDFGEPDHDFHFKVFRNGHWQQKNGQEPIELCNIEDWGLYTSDIIFFYHKINNN